MRVNPRVGSFVVLRNTINRYTYPRSMRTAMLVSALLPNKLIEVLCEDNQYHYVYLGDVDPSNG